MASLSLDDFGVIPGVFYDPKPVGSTRSQFCIHPFFILWKTFCPDHCQKPVYISKGGTRTLLVDCIRSLLRSFVVYYLFGGRQHEENVYRSHHSIFIDYAFYYPSGCSLLCQ